MNLPHIQFELTEASMHLQALVTRIREKRILADDATALSVELNHILNHICYAWNTKDLSIEQLQALPQEEFDRLCDTVPNFSATRILGDVACC